MLTALCYSHTADGHGLVAGKRENGPDEGGQRRGQGKPQDPCAVLSPRERGVDGRQAHQRTLPTWFVAEQKKPCGGALHIGEPTTTIRHRLVTGPRWDRIV